MLVFSTPSAEHLAWESWRPSVFLPFSFRSPSVILVKLKSSVYFGRAAAARRIDQIAPSSKSCLAEPISFRSPSVFLPFRTWRQLGNLGEGLPHTLPTMPTTRTSLPHTLPRRCLASPCRAPKGTTCRLRGALPFSFRSPSVPLPLCCFFCSPLFLPLPPSS